MSTKKQEQNSVFRLSWWECYIIYSMDFEEKRKRQTIRVVIAEIGMVLAIAVIVVVSTLAAMGFMISGNGGIEQSGLMQLHTLPTGASVKIDGNTIFARTNLSRTLSAGEHSLEIYRDNYDTWQKTIKIKSGVLVRIYYPRLFLQNRVAESVRRLATTQDLEFYEPSTNRNYVLYALNNAPEWQLLDLRGDDVKVTLLDLSGILPGMVEEASTRKTASVPETHTYQFRGKVEAVRWSQNEENVLVKISYESKSEWVLVRLKDIARSVNLTKTFGLSNGADLRIIDGSANQLYLLDNQQLRRISMGDGVMSRVLLGDVMSFANFEAKVIYATNANDEQKQIVGVYRGDEKGGTTLAEISEGKRVKVALSSYYGDDYMVWTADQELSILYGAMPSYDENRAELPSDLKYLMENAMLTESPEYLTVSPGNEFILAQKGARMMVVDLEMGDLYEYEAPGSGAAKWFDASMLYAVKNQQIIVWDFDGSNQRNLTESAKTVNDTMPIVDDAPVVIANNNRWLYYLVTQDGSTYLMREKVRD